MVRHPAYSGGVTCNAVTSQLDLAPTLLALTGAEASARAKAASGPKGRDFSSLLKKGAAAKPDEIRPASLFNYNMLSYQDAVWAEHFTQVLFSNKLTHAEKIETFLKNCPPSAPLGQFEGFQLGRISGSS